MESRTVGKMLQEWTEDGKFRAIASRKEAKPNSFVVEVDLFLTPIRGLDLLFDVPIHRKPVAPHDQF